MTSEKIYESGLGETRYNTKSTIHEIFKIMNKIKNFCSIKVGGKRM
jgi:hypothetical protein